MQNSRENSAEQSNQFQVLIIRTNRLWLHNRLLHIRRRDFAHPQSIA